jgi:uncharacterized membrane protein YidH (DUF202 family)
VNESPWDAGLQVERTALAWLRTCMAFLVGTVVLVRLAVHVSTTFAAVIACVVVPLAGAAAVLAWRRFRQADKSLRAEQPLPDGRLPAVMTAVALVAGLFCVGYLLFR